MKNNIFTLLVVVFLLTLSGCAKYGNQGVFSVTGNGSAMAKPDTAIITMGIDISRPTAKKAQTDNASVMQKVIDAIEKTGVNKNCIATSGYNVWPEMMYPTNKPPKISSYRCSAQVSITLSDLSKVSAVLDRGVLSGANSVQGISFILKNNDQLKNDAMVNAIVDAKKKAASSALKSGIKLGAIKRVVESSAIAPIPGPMMARADNALSGGAQTPVATGMIEIQSQVIVDFEIK